MPAGHKFRCNKNSLKHAEKQLLKPIANILLKVYYIKCYKNHKIPLNMKCLYNVFIYFIYIFWLALFVLWTYSFYIEAKRDYHLLILLITQMYR